MLKPRLILIGAGALFLPLCASAQPPTYSPTLTGPLGLNTVPNARMDQEGTITGGVSRAGRYTHGFLGVQLTPSFYVNIRQSGESSSIFKKPDRLYPGIDTKIRLWQETDFRPEVAIGLNSAFGHQRMASEYIALSKRYNNFDFTGGLAWGRMGGAGHIKNPLKVFFSHFGKDRPIDGDISTTPEQWFTGDRAAFFAGVEYFTPLDGLSLKADWGGDNYAAENAAGYKKAPSPWGFGLSYSPKSWMNAGLSIHGTDTIMGRINLKSGMQDWPLTRTPNRKQDKRLAPLRRTTSQSPTIIEEQARADGTPLYATAESHKMLGTALRLNSYETTPAQLRRAAVTLANQAGSDVEALRIRPGLYNLKGPTITLNRRDLENALAYNKGSAEEIWHSASISLDTSDEASHPLINASTESPDTNALTRLFQKPQHPGFLSFTLDHHFSLSEKDNGILHRTSLSAHSQSPAFFGLLHSFVSLRLNLDDNLKKMRETRPRVILPVRSDEDMFANRFLGLERSFLAATHSFTPEWHMAASAGYLEEMYGGFGGEILYRPFGKRYALGADAWIAMKRDPSTALNLGYNGDSLLTGHVNAWYEFPQHNTTLQARFGRYLAEDIGASLILKREFRNGASLEGFVTISEQADYDSFGGTTHAYNGLRFRMPLGGLPYVPGGSEVNVTAAPFGRDYGQALNNPLPLYEATTPLSYGHLAAHWQDITRPQNQKSANTEKPNLPHESP